MSELGDEDLFTKRVILILGTVWNGELRALEDGAG
jgi:hypothetical protein